MSYYVERYSKTTGGTGWTGPFRSAAQAERECMAWWKSGDTTATVVPSNPDTRAQMRAWEKAKKEAASR